MILVHVENKQRKGTTMNLNGMNRQDLKPGIRVLIVLKKDQRSGRLTEGVVKDILTKSSSHPHGIKVRLVSGEIGRVKEILSES
jgi:uncharacterized repeat protein (TIGR03833 family)